jgi:hypothetical protein
MTSAFGVVAAGGSGIACALPANAARTKAVAKRFRMVFGLLG